ncbi:hypothetical protein [Halomonas sp. 25-S5]|uniref:hypothetical protein n=1 Tax=Halomonas sp. 25-S5 TaxID=2994065 RepID=UPI002469C32B|nr:hypothetical protein [Halomonas sp. 25-S5]
MPPPAWTISHQVVFVEVGKVLHSLNILVKTGLDGRFHSDPLGITPQITGAKKQSEAALFGV